MAEGGSARPTRSGLLQFTAAVTKNRLQKQRNLRTTCCEIWSPLVLIWLLALGYGLSDILYFPARNYAQVNLDLPGKLTRPAGDLEAQGEGAAFNVGDLYVIQSVLNDVMSGPVPVPNFDSYVATSQLLQQYIDEDLYNELLGQSGYGRVFGTLFTLGHLHFAPAGRHTESLIHHLNTTTLTFQTLNIHVHGTESAALKHIDSHSNQRTWALIVLQKMGHGQVDYKLRLNYTTLPNTNYLVNWVTLGLDDRYQRYYLSGFHTLANTIDRWAFNETQIGGAFDGETTCEVPPFVGVPFPTAEYSQNLFYTAVGYLMGLAMTMATLYPVSRFIKDLVEEKETMMRETMAAMGMSLTANALAWAFVALLLFTWIASSTTFITSSSFLPSSEPSLLFAYFGLFCLSEISLCFLVSAFFSRAKLAAIVGPVVLFATCLPRYIFFGTNRYEEVQGKFAASLLSCTAFSFGADILADYEYANVGVNWSNFTEGAYSFQSCLFFMALDTVLYALLAVYLQVPPHIRHPLTFAFALASRHPPQPGPFLALISAPFIPRKYCQLSTALPGTRSFRFLPSIISSSRKRREAQRRRGRGCGDGVRWRKEEASTLR